MNNELVNLIESEFDRKRQKNRSYSLRAFARDLELSPSYLSLILNNKTTIKPTFYEKIIDKIIHNPKDNTYWKTQISDLKERLFYKGLIPEYKKHTKNIEMSWKHYAVLELFKLHYFTGTKEEINKYLKISLNESKEILSDLIQLNALKNEYGILKVTGISFSNIINGQTKLSGKKMQKDILEQSLVALEEVPIDLRNHTSMTIGINKSQIPKIMNRIKDFRRELCCEMSQEVDKFDAVYQLQISFFPANDVTTNINKEKK